MTEIDMLSVSVDEGEDSKSLVPQAEYMWHWEQTWLSALKKHFDEKKKGELKV